MISDKASALNPSRRTKRDAMIRESQATRAKEDTKERKMNFMMTRGGDLADHIEVERDTEVGMLKLAPMIKPILTHKSKINPRSKIRKLRALQPPTSIKCQCQNLTISKSMLPRI